MGGNKKKTLAAMEKEQAREELKKQGALEKKKKEEKKEEKLRSKSEYMMSLSEADVMKVIRSVPYITPYTLSKLTGVKVSVARILLRQYEEKGLLSKIGGYSGRNIYVPKVAA